MLPALQPLGDSVGAARGAMQSAVTLISGISAKIQAGIDAAMADGVTPEALTELTDLKNGLDTDAQALAAQVAANP